MSDKEMMDSLRSLQSHAHPEGQTAEWAAGEIERLRKRLAASQEQIELLLGVQSKQVLQIVKLRAIVERWPTLADGTPLDPQHPVWARLLSGKIAKSSGEIGFQKWGRSRCRYWGALFKTDGCIVVRIASCYSTRGAAEAAKEKS